MQQYDVAIVGGSCAGTAAGHTLALAGKKTIIIDKAIFPRKKLCGGIITEKTIDLLKLVYGDVSTDSLVELTYDTMGMYHADEGKVCAYTHPSSRLHSIDRPVFDDHFLKIANTSGCSVINGEKVIRIDSTRITTDSGTEISADYIIGADGANSIVRKSLYSAKKKKHFSMALELDIGYQDLNCFDDEPGLYPKLYFGFMNSGYGWVFPKKNFATVGIGGLVHANKESLKDLYLNFLRSVCKCDISPLVHNIAGFPVPLQNLTRKPAVNNIFLTGDAAGFVEPITGEGIYFAILSGKLAADAILSGTDMANTYNRMIRKNISGFLNQAYLVKRFLFQPKILSRALSKMNRNAKYCKYFFEVVSGDIDYNQYMRRVIADRKIYPSI